ncbi:MAG: hypothetical protein HY646_15360, partial [Acidobacteria bacterium]|nr:hypothetical protein [Acidobacteriota bacterium]
FDCVYCECSTPSWSKEWELRPRFPDADDVRIELAKAVSSFNPDELDSITICGNGEPTLSRHLGAIVDAVSQARDYYWPQARTVILTNGSACHRPHVFQALARLDERVVKLDAGTNWMLNQLNRPTEDVSVSDLVWRISIVPDITVQSMFVEGPVDNTRPEHVLLWIERLKMLRPLAVQIYSLDREPALPWVQRVCREKLEEIARQVETAVHVTVHVY